MAYPAALTEEVSRNASAGAAMAILEDALARRSCGERRAFWHAIDLAYLSRKAPPKAVVPASGPPASSEGAPTPTG